MSETSENFKNIISFILPKLRCNDENLFGAASKIWYSDLNQSSNDWEQLSLLINTPGKIRREEIYKNTYYDYVYEWDSNADIDDIIKIGDQVQNTLKGSGTLFKLETSD